MRVAVTGGVKRAPHLLNCPVAPADNEKQPKPMMASIQAGARAVHGQRTTFRAGNRTGSFARAAPIRKVRSCPASADRGRHVRFDRWP